MEISSHGRDEVSLEGNRGRGSGGGIDMVEAGEFSVMDMA
jgi:predicted outer membrane repeat protein